MTTELDTTSAPSDSPAGARNALSDLPKIDISGGDLHRQVDEAWEALMDANDPQFPRVMVRGNVLVRMAEQGIERLSISSLVDELSRVATFGTTDKKDEFQPRNPPEQIARILIDRDSAEYVGGPRIDRVVDVPVLTSAGQLLTRPGYDADSRLFYRPADDLSDLVVPEPDSLDLNDVDDAVNLLTRDLLGDFAFTDEASRANALAMLLTPFVRDYIDGPTPLFAIRAHGPGWGKGLLTDVVLRPGCGSVPRTAGAESDEEWRKRITSALRKAPIAIAFDNIARTLDSAALAQATVEDVWNDRILGGSDDLTVPVRNVWTVNGNNLTLSAELADRNVPIVLAPPESATEEVEVPRRRTSSAWSHPELSAWAKENRGRLASAALVLVRHWLDGRVTASADYGASVMREPEERWEPTKSMGSFRAWASIVGGVLQAAHVDGPDDGFGVAGFLENRDRVASEISESDGDGTDEFFATWHGLDLEPLTSPELVSECTTGQLRDFLPDGLAGLREPELHKRLPIWLREHNGNWTNGRRVINQQGGKGNRRRWYVVTSD